jgi:hypothetical protein
MATLAGACASSRASEQPTSTTRRVPIERAASATPTSAALPTATPADAPDSAAPVEATATPTLVHEVLPITQAPADPPTSDPAPAPVRGGANLQTPDGTSVVWGGCSTDGECHDYNFYWAPTHEAVMQYGEGQNKVEHELCHAHQHWSINGGAPLDGSDYDLESWYSTPEGEGFTAAVAGLPWVWSHSSVNSIEDFAWTCGYWYFDAAFLLNQSPERYAWAAANLP